MNSIPSTFSENEFNYLITGSDKRLSNATVDLCALILNRDNSQFRYYIFDNLISKGFSRIICVENKSSNLNTDAISEKYPEIEFVVCLEDLTQGEMINLGMTLCDSPYVLVLQEELCVENFRFNENIFNFLIEKNPLCVCPKLISQNYQILSGLIEPYTYKSNFVTKVSNSFGEMEKTLCSTDYVGLYNRKLFLETNGFDGNIETPYWQQMDFFVRGFLQGKETYISNLLSFTYSCFEINENQSLDKNYYRFYVKNLLPVYKNGEFQLKKSSLFECILNKSCLLFERIMIFNYTRKWIRENKSAFQKDIVKLIEDWGE